jgi:hypothetical protein
MFNQELGFYGIPSAEDLITVQGNFVITVKKNKCRKIKKKICIQSAKAKREHEMFFLVVECNHQFDSLVVKRHSHLVLLCEQCCVRQISD